MDNKINFTLTNCDFEFECPRKWNDLISTEDPNIRHCQHCDQSVTLCTSQKDYESLVSEGKCIAIDIPQNEMHDNERCQDLYLPRRLGYVNLETQKPRQLIKNVKVKN